MPLVPARPIAGEPRDTVASGAMLATTWELRLLGGLEARCGDLVLTHFSSRPAAALLARLALWPNQRHSREQLIELLWPEVAPDVGRNRFRQVLATLRGLIEPPGWPAGSVLSADRLTVQLRPGAMVCDAVEFEALVQGQQTAAASRRYGGELMPGFYDEWVVEERERLEALKRRVDHLGCDAAPGAVQAPDQRVAGSMHSLPAAMGSFFGRESELGELADLLAGQRLVTLCGPGGCGKTRLAVEVTRRCDSWGRTAFVALAECKASTEVFERVRAALRLPVTAARAPQQVVDQIAEHLAERPALLVLDNYEQLVDEAGIAAVAMLLDQVPRLSVLVTSRRLLQLPGEFEFALAPLPLPETDTTLARAAENPGIALFVDRARGARRDFHLGEANLRDIVTLCQVLEGLPLALELAAAKVRAYSVGEMCAELEQGHALLARGGAPGQRRGRHGSLRAAIEWSWQLLDPAHRRFASTLTAFRGGWNADAARAVTDAADAHHSLDELVGDSLIQATPDGRGGLRFSMLDSVREYARGQMAAVDSRRARQRHRAYFLARALSIGPDHESTADIELPNFLMAIEAGLDDGEVAIALALGLALKPHWESRGADLVARGLLRRAAEQVPADTPRYSEFLSMLARILAWAGQAGDAHGFAKRALLHAGADLAQRANALCVDAQLLWITTLDGARVLEPASEALRLATESGAKDTEAKALVLLGAAILGHLKDTAMADALFARAEAVHLELGNARGALASWHGRIDCLFARGELARVIELSLSCERKAEQLGHGETQLLFLSRLSGAYKLKRQYVQALEVGQREARVARRQHKVYNLSYALWNQCQTLARLRRPEDAAAMMAFSQRYWFDHFGPLHAGDGRYIELVRRLVVVQIGVKGWLEQWERGLALSVNAGLDLACDG